MLLSWIGTFFRNVFALTAVIYYDEIPAEFLVFQSLAYTFGGWIGFLLGVHSFIADTSSGRSAALS